MRVFLLAAMAAFLSLLTMTTAEAKRHEASSDAVPFWEQNDDQPSAKRSHARRRHNSDEDGEAEVSHSRHARHTSSHESVAHEGLGGRPSAWCGWYMRSRHGGGPEYNLAANWAHRGTPTHPHVGAIVVWSHHVGEITGQTSDGRWIVLSGNDSHAVKERARSVSGAVFRDI